ncbi:Hypothetical predicted protein, partial [Olea europaea subsp. europaea]
CQKANLHPQGPEEHGKSGAIIDSVVPVDNTPDPSKVFQLNVQLKWEVARDPLHKGNNIDKPSMVGPGIHSQTR